MNYFTPNSALGINYDDTLSLLFIKYQLLATGITYLSVNTLPLCFSNFHIEFIQRSRLHPLYFFLYVTTQHNKTLQK